MTTQLPAGTGLVLNGQEAGVVWTRQGLTVEFSDSHADYFQRNLTAIRAEERIALGITRPAAIVSVTGLA